MERVLNRKTVSISCRSSSPLESTRLWDRLVRASRVIDPVIKDAEDRTGVQCIRVDTPRSYCDTAEVRSETERMSTAAEGRHACLTIVCRAAVGEASHDRRLDDYIKMIRSIHGSRHPHICLRLSYADAMDRR